MLEKIRAATAANRVYFLGSIFFMLAQVLVSVVILIFPNMPEMLNWLMMYVPAIISFGVVGLWYQKKYGKQVAPYTPAKTSQFFKVIPVVILGMLAMLPITALSMVINEKIWGINIINNVQKASVPTPQTGGELIWALIVFAVLPAIIEETLFRGTLQRGNAPNLGKWAPIYAGFAFGIMHMNFVTQWGLILVGIIIGLILRETGSLKLCIWYHFLHNAIAVTLGFASEKMTSWLEQMNPAAVQSAEVIPSQVYTPVVLVVYFVIGIGAFIGAWAIIRSMRKYKGTAMDQTTHVTINDPQWVAPVLSIEKEQQYNNNNQMNSIEKKAERFNEEAGDVKPLQRVNYVWYILGIVWSLALGLLQTVALGIGTF